MAKNNTKCFALLFSNDENPTPCRWKSASKKHGPQVSLSSGGEFVNVTCVGDVNLTDEITLEFWQMSVLTDTTTINDIFNLPICSSFLIFPVIFRVTASVDIPTLGRIKKLLCEQVENMMASQFIHDEEEDVLDEEPVFLDQTTSATTIEEEDDDLDLGSSDHDDEDDDLELDAEDVDLDDEQNEDDDDDNMSIDDD